MYNDPDLHVEFKVRQDASQRWVTCGEPDLARADANARANRGELGQITVGTETKCRAGEGDPVRLQRANDRPISVVPIRHLVSASAFRPVGSGRPSSQV